MGGYIPQSCGVIGRADGQGLAVRTERQRDDSLVADCEAAANLAVRGHIPQLHGAVGVSHGQNPGVRAQCHGVGISGNGTANRATGGYVPELNGGRPEYGLVSQDIAFEAEWPRELSLGDGERHADPTAGSHVPYLDDAIAVLGGPRFPVSAEHRRGVGTDGQGDYIRFQGADVPQPYGAVFAAGGKRRPVRTECHRVNRAAGVTAGQGAAKLLTGGCVPQHRRTVFATGGESRAVLAERQ